MEPLRDREKFLKAWHRTRVKKKRKRSTRVLYFWSSVKKVENKVEGEIREQRAKTRGVVERLVIITFIFSKYQG